MRSILSQALRHRGGFAGQYLRDERDRRHRTDHEYFPHGCRQSRIGLSIGGADRSRRAVAGDEDFTGRARSPETLLGSDGTRGLCRDTWLGPGPSRSEERTGSLRTTMADW
jgi:hypothetical protein